MHNEKSTAIQRLQGGAKRPPYLDRVRLNLGLQVRVRSFNTAQDCLFHMYTTSMMKIEPNTLDSKKGKFADITMGCVYAIVRVGVSRSM